ncbi:MAG: DUF881 domain-containing protein [Actinomycetota bacterium]|nr:DUF881 domain-containing protein [Actinomycetota bacterium]
MTGEHRAESTTERPPPVVHPVVAEAPDPATTGVGPAAPRPAASGNITADGPKRSGGNRTGGPLVSLLILGLCALLGFGIATQVRRTAAGDTLATLRPDDLVQILDGLQQRQEDVDTQIRTLSATLARLQAGGASSAEALAEAKRQAGQLGILAGTVAAHGPGVKISIGDPARSVSPEVLLAVIQELRNAGAEAMQLNGIRIGMDSAFTGSTVKLVLDGKVISQPFVIVAIGDPPTLSAAMAIPGGVVDSVRRTGATIVVAQAQIVTVGSLRAQRVPQYARPAG